MIPGKVITNLSEKSISLKSAKKINEGFRHHVWKVKTNQEDNAVLKVFGEEWNDSSQRCMKEAKIYSLLKSEIPLPKLIDFSAEESCNYLLMEDVKGISLSRHLINNEEPNKDIIKEAANTLAKIHSIDGYSIFKDFSNENSFDNVIGTNNDIERIPDKKQKSLIKEIIIQIKNHPLSDKLRKTDNVLVHGDYKVSNIIVNDGHISAIVDWEDAHIGSIYTDFKIIQEFSHEASSDFLRSYSLSSKKSINRNLLDFFTDCFYIKTSVDYLSHEPAYKLKESKRMEVRKNITKVTNIIYSKYM